MWRAHASAEAYVNDDYQPDDIIREIFAHLFSIKATYATPADRHRPAYDTPADLADDGIFTQENA
eukprot:SAG31_NODE_9592_length_1253_cov_1.070996_1_plen_65_part_10